eukprot:scaffold3673_cov157-Skeletonema_menzelii.AAC.1
MKIKSTFFSRRRSPAAAKSEPEPLPVPEAEPDMLSKTLLLQAPATTNEPESRTATETTNEPDESRTAAATASDELKPAAATANEPDELKADPIEESRGGDGRRVSPAFDAGVAFGRFLNDSSTVLFGAVSEAKNIANDISNIVAAEVRDLELELDSAITSTAKDLAAEVDDWRSGLEHFNERVHFNESTAEEWS